MEVVKGPFNMARGSLAITPSDDVSVVTVTAEYLTPFDGFQKTLEQKLGLLADMVVDSARRHILASA